MWYKGYYTLKCTVEEPIQWWSIDYINVGQYSFDVSEIDGMDYEGNKIDAAGSVRFECLIDGEEAEIDWDDIDEGLENIEIVLSINDYADYKIKLFKFSIYDDDNKEHYGEICDDKYYINVEFRHSYSGDDDEEEAKAEQLFQEKINEGATEDFGSPLLNDIYDELCDCEGFVEICDSIEDFNISTETGAFWSGSIDKLEKFAHVMQQFVSPGTLLLFTVYKKPFTGDDWLGDIEIYHDKINGLD